MSVYLQRRCPFCPTDTSLYVDPGALRKWTKGALIQIAFPDLNDSERERIKTGICDSCWQEAMS